ncbi:MAG: beta-propeller domain-containing protein [Candidatus Bathyarchaeota archaeon]|nr:beta-propeller domain-containing protein [Candidatus Termiticorpusculum sp.]
MVQKELKRKTKLYTLVAVLSAVLLVSAIYTVTTPPVMYGLLGISPMKHFTSIEELRTYLITNTQNPTAYPDSFDNDSGSEFWSRPDSVEITGSGFESSMPPIPTPLPSSIPSAATDSAAGAFTTSTTGFSTTNVQVAGVDEVDIVKTDGKYIYTLNVNYDNELCSSVQIVRADPQSPEVVGKIAFDSSTYIYGMYLSEDGNKLAILGNHHQYFGIMPLNEIVPRDDDVLEPMPTSAPSDFFWPYNTQTFVYVYDVSNKAEPVLARDLTLSGNYINSRMAGDYIYLIVNQSADLNDETVFLPRVSIDAVTKEIAPTSIYYADIQDAYFSYTTFTSLNIMNDAEQPTSMTILMGASSCMYVSTHNMYVTFNKYESTEIYRVSFKGANMSFRAQGTVPGYVLNQYSMDEYDNHFRIATTVSTGTWDNRIDYNNVYVLNMNLGTVGKIENLAQGERIYSARFAGDKAYLVTFEQIDPFFVLDLKDPTSPKVTGELKIPGFSNYLHPYSENYVIGIGQENNAVKLSLFDVTDVSNPIEIAKYVIGENADYTQSPAQYDPKAFLFDPQKQLLVIPISISNYSIYEPFPAPEYDSTDNSTLIVFPREMQLIKEGSFWQGAYVFSISPENGFTLQGELSHQSNSNNYWYNYYDSITRSLYIGNTLYTISNSMVQLNSLDDLSLIAQVIF